MAKYPSPVEIMWEMRLDTVEADYNCTLYPVVRYGRLIGDICRCALAARSNLILKLFQTILGKKNLRARAINQLQGTLRNLFVFLFIVPVSKRLMHQHHHNGKWPVLHLYHHYVTPN